MRDPRVMAAWLGTVIGEGDVFTRVQARAAGISDEEIRRAVGKKVWHRLRRGAYCSSDVWNTADAGRRQVLGLTALNMIAKPPVVGSHETAAAVLRLELWEPSYEWLHITRPLHSGRREAGVWHHQAGLEPRDVVTVSGLSVTSPLRTALDVARRTDLEHGVVALDSALRLSGSDLVALQELHIRCRDWPGAAVAGRAVAAADPRAESVGESRTRVQLAAARLPTPATQVAICDEAGRLIGVVDFLLGDKTIVEFDGRLKYGLHGLEGEALSARLWREKQREDALRRAGFEVVRLVWADLYHPERIQSYVRVALAAATTTPPARGVLRSAARPRRLVG